MMNDRIKSWFINPDGKCTHRTIDLPCILNFDLLF